MSRRQLTTANAEDDELLLGLKKFQVFKTAIVQRRTRFGHERSVEAHNRLQRQRKIFQTAELNQWSMIYMLRMIRPAKHRALIVSALSCLRHICQASCGQPKGFGPIYREPAGAGFLLSGITRA
jgi:hypothetical protein